MSQEGELKPKSKLRLGSTFGQPFVPDGGAAVASTSQSFTPAAPAQTNASKDGTGTTGVRKQLKPPSTNSDFVPAPAASKLQANSAVFNPQVVATPPPMPAPTPMNVMYNYMPAMQPGYAQVPGMGFPAPLMFTPQQFYAPQMMPSYMPGAQGLLLPNPGMGLPMPSQLMPNPLMPTPMPAPAQPSSDFGREGYNQLKHRIPDLANKKSEPFIPEVKPEPVVETKSATPAVPQPELAKKEPEPIIKDDDDDEEEDTVIDTEDYSKYSQEKPVKLIYPREWIKEFLAKEKNIDDKKFDERFEDLDRDIQSLPKGSGGGGRIGGYNSGNRNDRKPRGSDKGRHYERPDDRYREPYPKKESRPPGRYGSHNDYPPSQSGTTGLVRKIETAQDREKLEKFKDESTNRVAKANLDDEETKTNKNINFTLNQLASENFSHCLETLSGYLVKSPQLCEKIVGMLIDKAWSQTTYTELFSKLLAKLGESKMEWYANTTPEQQQEIQRQYRESDPIKIFKNIIVSKVRKEFNEGFERLQNIMHSAEDNKEFNDERKTIEYNKSRDKFLANMSFIAQLYKLKYLPHKVMRTIAFQICDKFMMDFCEKSFSHYRYKTCDVFLMAFFKLMAVAGTTMEKKEVSEKEKEVTQPRDKWEENQRKKSKAFVDVMIKCVKEGEYNQSEVISRFGDADKKEVNFINVVFDFVEALVQTGKITLLLKSFCVTAIEERKGGWKPPTPAPTPAAPVEQKQRYQEQPEYVVKQPSNPAKANIEFEIEEIFKKYKTYNEIEVYRDAFAAGEEQFKGVSASDIFAAYLRFFLKHGSKDIFFIRAQIAGFIITNFKLEESQFWGKLATALAKYCNEDIPARTKALGLVINEGIVNFKFDIKNMEPVLDSDPDEKENQLYFYQDVIDESVKDLTASGKSPEAVESLKAYKATKLKL